MAVSTAPCFLGRALLGGGGYCGLGGHRKQSTLDPTRDEGAFSVQPRYKTTWSKTDLLTDRQTESSDIRIHDQGGMVEGW